MRRNISNTNKNFDCFKYFACIANANIYQNYQTGSAASRTQSVTSWFTEPSIKTFSKIEYSAFTAIRRIYNNFQLKFDCCFSLLRLSPLPAQ